VIDIRPDHLAIIKDILAHHAPGCEVRAFGSRVTRTVKKHSDLDLEVMDTPVIGPETIDRLREAFVESDLPFRVDVLDWNDISPEFRKVIEQKYEVVQEGNTIGLEYGK
jgi:predicted nucleotidyltransferase